MLRDIYREAQFCYQDGTQVLTDRGFIDFKELKLEDKIATTPLESGELQYRKPKAIHSFDYNGDMYHFKTRQVPERSRNAAASFTVASFFLDDAMDLFNRFPLFS